MNSSDFPVGSIVYFLHNKTERVLPAQVTEKIVRTSLSGSRATYIIAVQSKDAIKNIEVDPEEVKVFQTPDEMKDFMVARATSAISSLLDAAVHASAVFENVIEPPTAPVLDGVSAKEIDPLWHTPAAERPITGRKKNDGSQKQEYTEVDMGDGTKARLKI